MLCASTALLALIEVQGLLRHILSHWTGESQTDRTVFALRRSPLALYKAHKSSHCLPSDHHTISTQAFWPIGCLPTGSTTMSSALEEEGSPCLFLPFERLSFFLRDRDVYDPQKNWIQISFRVPKYRLT